jgi:hypothetical protein
MSLVEKYKTEGQALSGCLLGFKSFFSQFSVIEFTSADIERMGRDFNSNPLLIWNGKSLSNEYRKIEPFCEFINEQLKWVNLPRSTGEQQHHSMRTECQKRINFFVAELHTLVWNGGVDGKAHYYLRDIRSLATLCLKQ